MTRVLARLRELPRAPEQRVRASLSSLPLIFDLDLDGYRGEGGWIAKHQSSLFYFVCEHVAPNDSPPLSYPRSLLCASPALQLPCCETITKLQSGVMPLKLSARLPDSFGNFVPYQRYQRLAALSSGRSSFKDSEHFSVSYLRMIAWTIFVAVDWWKKLVSLFEYRSFSQNIRYLQICQTLINKRNILLFKIGDQDNGKMFVLYIFKFWLLIIIFV